MFEPYTSKVTDLKPGDLIRYHTPHYHPVQQVFQGVVIGVTRQPDQTNLTIRLPMTNMSAGYVFKNDDLVVVTGQLSQAALDFLEDFRAFQPKDTP